MTSPGLTAQAVADLVGGRLLGHGTTLLREVGPLDRAGPETLSFLVSAKYLPYFRASLAGAVLMAEEFSDEPAGPGTRIVVTDPYRALLQALTGLHPPASRAIGIDVTARLGRGVVLGRDVSIGPHAVLGERVRLGECCEVGAGAVLGDGVIVGDHTIIGPHVVCYTGTRLGQRVVLKAGAVLGGVGFGYASSPEGHDRIPHIGACVIEDDVEIGSHTCIDRGSIDDTVIGRGTKIDNLVHVGHNVRLGERCLVMATSGIAGSTRVGHDVIVAGGAGVANHLTIGDRARISARSGVFGNVEPGATVGGYPARRHRDFLRAQAALYRLPAIIDRLEALAQEQNARATTND